MTESSSLVANCANSPHEFTTSRPDQHAGRDPAVDVSSNARRSTDQGPHRSAPVVCENRTRMLSLQNAGKRFGPRVLFLEANWLIRAKEKTALVGANGTGKSTLMKVLAGLESLDYGTMQQTRGMSIGYLPQEGLRLTGRTMFEECLTVFDEIRDMEREIERLGGQLGELDHASPEYDSAAERFSMLQDRFHALDGYALDAQVGSVLTGLGFQQGRLVAPDR